LYDREKEIERLIVNLTDHLIQSCMSASLLEDDIRAHHIRRSANTVLEISSLLIEVLPGRENYLYNLLQQLTTQRLPNKRVMESFGSFWGDLDAIIKEGLLLYSQKKEEKYIDSDNNQGCSEGTPQKDQEVSSDTPIAIEPVIQKTDILDCLPTPLEETRKNNPTVICDWLLIKLQKYLPGSLILANWKYRGNNVDYYLPGHKLILMRPGRLIKSHARLHYFAENEGMTLIWLEEKDLQDEKKLCRKIKKR